MAFLSFGSHHPSSFSESHRSSEALLLGAANHYRKNLAALCCWNRRLPNQSCCHLPLRLFTAPNATLKNIPRHALVPCLGTMKSLQLSGFKWRQTAAVHCCSGRLPPLLRLDCCKGRSPTPTKLSTAKTCLLHRCPTKSAKAVYAGCSHHKDLIATKAVYAKWIVAYPGWWHFDTETNMCYKRSSIWS